MGKFKIKPHQQKSTIQEVLEAKRLKASLENNDCFKVCFQHIDRGGQGQTYHDWQNTSMLAEAFETLAGCCGKSITSQQGKKFTIYGNFPAKDKTDFYHPDHVPEDADWARIHVNGTHCLIGHVLKDTFYLVFFDAEHKFWKSELKHT